MYFKSLLVSACLLTTPVIAHADFLSFTMGGGFWNESPDGSVQKTTDPIPVDLKDDLFFDSESQAYVFASFEHFVPLVPNVRVIYTNVDHTGNGTASFNFDGKTFSGNVASDIKIKTLDLIAYYEILDNIVSLDLGLVVRNLSVDYNITGLATTTSDSISQTIPMLYAVIGASPWPELLLSAEMSYIGFSGSSMSDFTAKVSYTSNFLVGVEAGYRSQKIVLDDVDNTNADLSFDGPFVGAYLKF